jgi:pyruvate formate lyase activating enzyme
MNEKNLQVPILAIARHRLVVDGQGVTTLVGFHGCTLRCKYCINAQCLQPNGIHRIISPIELLDEVKIDNLYFIATGGGITFGGGEPALRSEFIEEFCQLTPQEWNITMETALNVERQHLERLLPYNHLYIIDIKDINPDTYKHYTGMDNQRVIDNLKWLLGNEGLAQRIIIKLPLIKGYNTHEDVNKSRQFLTSLGVTNFNELTYSCNLN